MKRGTAAVAVAALVWSNAPIVTHQIPVASAAATAEKSLSSQIVKLNSKSTLSISNAQFLMQDKGKVLAFTVTITNNSSSPIDLTDYWLRIKTKSGKSFKANVKESDKEITTISPKTSQFITYYSVVDNATTLTDLMFEVVKWDFNVANYERTLGVIKASSKETNQAAAYKAQVMIVNSTKIRSAIKQAFITKDQGNAYIAVNFLLENVGLKPADLSKINFYIQTESNSVYKVSAAELETMSLQPNERKITTLTVKLPSSVASKKLSLVMGINDEASKVILPTGAFLLPALTSSPVTAVGKQRSVYLSGQQVTTSIGKASLEDKGDESGLSVDYKLVNNGSEAIKLPELEIYLRTKQNVNYPLTFTKDETNLLPGIEKTLTLTGDIPSSVKVADAEIVVRTVPSDKDLGYVVGTYKTNSTIQEGSLGSAFTLDKYSIKLNNIQRSPLEDSDMLVADLSITNNDKVSRKIPSLSGYFLINGVKVEGEATAVALDDTISIAPGEIYNMVVYTKIPYTTTVNKIAFVAVEPVKDKAAKVLYQFSGQSLSAVPSYSTTTPYEITSVGKKSSVKLIRHAVFSSLSNKQFYAEFVVENKESRMANIGNLGGYLLDSQGQVVPITFASLKNKVLPNGKVLLTAWAILPSGFTSDQDYRLYLGQAVGSTDGSGGGTTGTEGNAASSSSAIARMVSYQLTKSSQVGVNTSLNNISVAGYSISLSKLYAQLRTSGSYTIEGVEVRSYYTLEKDSQYDYVTGDHKLTFEFVNGDSKQATFTKTYSLPSSVSDGSKSQEDQLKTGTNIELSIPFNADNVQSQIDEYKQYTLNIYDEFQGTKLLIATKELTWFKEQ